MKTICGVMMAALMLLPTLGGCATPKAQEQSKDFFTSGDKDADQRASQRMAKSQQLSGQSGADQAATPARQKVAATNPVAAAAISKSVEAKNDAAKSLYDRLGGDAGIRLIVEDFTPRILADPRVNFQRKGVKYGGFSVHHNRSEEWKDTPGSEATLRYHMIQFLSLATGGPSKYEGKEMTSAHAELHITNAEFDASVGDLKATLDKLEVPNREQKELLAVVESARAQIVTER